MKRSKCLHLVLLGASPLIMTGCNDKPETGFLYRDPLDCQSGGLFKAGLCEQEYARVLALHRQIAPRYTTQADCEADFGSARCQGVDQVSGAYAPLLSGYLLGTVPVSATGSQGQRLDWLEQRFPSEPLYQGLGDDHLRSNCNEYVGRRSGPLLVSNALTRIRPAPHVQRGGFGLKASALCSQGG
ncbi:hypothetical protein APT59_00925 [Pseudomonas oryzihabitans]|uniref:DUF1190 domain-containing protein n=1 Tax=Pseudomonas oryzihabitans TaxID=47885 RepID=A0A0U4WCG0_9PSED|nr:DUF1190 domain-containing protein [Pseudomonas oryzihabitans]ALZ82834.1 hypothetical protein APT59_00925 [Pseudomonas oryzihabitans]